MFSFKKNLGEKYTPLYFLASLGAGGLSISMFLYLMFMIKHTDTPLVTFNHIYPLLVKGDAVSALIGFVLLWVIFFAFMHFKSLFWNIKEYKLFKTTEAFANLKKTNAEVTLMAAPLTFAMTVNVCFVLGATFVPNLWSIIELLLPGAIIAFWIVGFYALKIFGNYMSRLIINGDFDFTQNSNLSQMLAIFAFSMIAVGLAAPGAMSHHISTSAIGLFSSIFFTAIASMLLLIKLVLGFKSMFAHGIKAEAAPSLWIVIPIFTLLGITLVRQSFGLVHNFNQPFSGSSLFYLTSFLLSLQIIFGLIGHKVLTHLNYFKDYIHGDKKSPGSFALICPGVAFFVFGMFFIVFGLMKSGVVKSFVAIFLAPQFPWVDFFIAFALLAPFMYVQFVTVKVFFKLTKKILVNK
jgi:hypothetical protein